MGGPDLPPAPRGFDPLQSNEIYVFGDREHAPGPKIKNLDRDRKKTAHKDKKQIVVKPCLTHNTTLV